MKKRIFYIIKYSVEYVALGNRSMQLAKRTAQKGQAHYKGKLFSEKRLALRSKLFKNITLPSMRAALENDDAYLVILTSEALPTKYKKQLEEMLRGIGNVVIRYCKPIKSVDSEARESVLDILRKTCNRKEKEICLATIRLDDDDALANNYTQLLLPYVRPDLSGFYVSFPLGVRLSIKHGRFVLTKCYLPKTSQGLARIEVVDPFSENSFQTTYGGGSHVGVDKRGPAILDAREIAYVRTNHVDNDSGMRPLEWARHWIQVSAEPLAERNKIESEVSLNLDALGVCGKKTLLQGWLSPVSSLVYRST